MRVDLAELGGWGDDWWILPLAWSPFGHLRSLAIFFGSLITDSLIRHRYRRE